MLKFLPNFIRQARDRGITKRLGNLDTMLGQHTIDFFLLSVNITRVLQVNLNLVIDLNIGPFKIGRAQQVGDLNVGSLDQVS